MGCGCGKKTVRRRSSTGVTPRINTGKASSATSRIEAAKIYQSGTMKKGTARRSV